MTTAHRIVCTSPHRVYSCPSSLKVCTRLRIYVCLHVLEDQTAVVFLAFQKNKLVQSLAFSKRLVISHPFITCYLSAIHMSRWLWHYAWSIKPTHWIQSNAQHVVLSIVNQSVLKMPTRQEASSIFHCKEHFEANMIVTVYGCLIALLFRYWWVCRWLCRVWQ